MAISIHIIICLIGVEIECINQETTMLLHICQAEYIGWFLAGKRCEPRMNSNLFFALNVVTTDLLQE